MARPELRALLAGTDTVFAPAVWDPATARLARHTGFRVLHLPAAENGLYVGEGAGLTTLTQTVSVAERALEGVADQLPMVVDARSTTPAEAALAARSLEDAAMSGMHLLDAGGDAVALAARLQAALAARRSEDFMVIAGVQASGDRNATLARARGALAAGAHALCVQGLAGDTAAAAWYCSQFPGAALAAYTHDGGWFRNVRGQPLSLGEWQAMGFRLVFHARVLQPALMAVRDVYRHVKDTGALPAIPQRELDEVMEVWWALVGMEEKWAVEAATTEKPAFIDKPAKGA